MRTITRQLKVAKAPTAVPARRIIDQRVYANVFEAARMLDVHWTRIYALLREARLDPERVHKEGRQTWIRLDAIAAYRAKREFWLNLHGGGSKNVVTASR